MSQAKRFAGKYNDAQREYRCLDVITAGTGCTDGTQIARKQISAAAQGIPPCIEQLYQAELHACIHEDVCV